MARSRLRTEIRSLELSRAIFKIFSVLIIYSAHHCIFTALRYEVL